MIDVIEAVKAERPQAGITRETATRTNDTETLQYFSNIGTICTTSTKSFNSNFGTQGTPTSHTSTLGTVRTNGVDASGNAAKANDAKDKIANIINQFGGVLVKSDTSGSSTKSKSIFGTASRTKSLAFLVNAASASNLNSIFGTTSRTTATSSSSDSNIFGTQRTNATLLASVNSAGASSTSARSTALSTSTLYGCTSLKTVDLRKTRLNTLPQTFVQGCTSLETIAIPKTLGYFNNGAFYGCTNLKQIKGMGSIWSGLSEQEKANIVNTGNSNGGIFFDVNVFYGTGFTKLDFAPFNQTATDSVGTLTLPNLENTPYQFSNSFNTMTNLTEVDFSNFKTANNTIAASSTTDTPDNLPSFHTKNKAV